MMDTDHREVSTRLSAVLDNIGASEDVRKLYWDTSMASEIADTLSYLFFASEEHSCYQFGSSCEGTTTLWLQSDTDFMTCRDYMSVIDNINDATARPCYLMVKDCNTKPGYVRLQKVKDGIPQCFSLGPAICGEAEFDESGRNCLIHPTFMGEAVFTKHGPAMTALIGTHWSDYVHALRCRKVPNSANSWIHRIRKYDWPSQKQILKMKSFGCFLVGVRHPNSNKKSIEWRLSFSLQERELMSGINQTQHKCYILLKMIKKEIIEPRTGESISSYHCKTCLFYTIETSESRLWIPQNLIMCTRMCLMRLLDWSKNENCPNYFIPEENMFDKLDKQTLVNVDTALTHILSSGMQFPFWLKCDNIGALLRKNLSAITHDTSNTHKCILCNITMKVINAKCNLRNRCLKNVTVENFSLQRLLKYLQDTNNVTEHSTRDVRLAMGYIIPHIHLQIAQGLASAEIRRVCTTTNDPLPLDIILNIMESSSSGRISARLSLAAFYFQFGILEACEQLLLEIQASFTPCVISVCSCYRLKTYAYISLGEKLLTESKIATTKEFIEQYTAACLVFLQSQTDIVHPAVKYEMYRSVYTAAVSRTDSRYLWFEWVVVDPKVYLDFLQYIFCTKTNKPEHTARIVETLRHIIQDDKSLTHTETAYNLLGWILKKENRTIEAWQCLCRSWRIKPFHNAAKWHILLLLNDSLRSIKFIKKNYELRGH